MVIFKLKNFSKVKSLKSAGKFLKDHPVLPISAASLGISVANYRTNNKRREEGVEQHKEQIKTLKQLNNNILKNSEALNAVNSALKDNTNNLSARSLNMALIPQTTAEKRGQSRRGIRSLFRKKERQYSIQDGGFKGRKIEPKKSSVGVGAGVGAAAGTVVGLAMSNNNPATKGAVAFGAIIGAGVGALAVWLNNVAKESIFNLGLATRANSYTLIKKLEAIYSPEEKEVVEESKTTTTNNNTTHTTVVRKSSPKSNVSPVGMLFNIDSDPKKHVVNLLLRGNVMLILLYKPNNLELSKMNHILDGYCSRYKLADYSSTKIESGVYLVEVNIVDNSEASLVRGIIESGMKVNILTTDRFGIKNT